jgi:hypothetical protein
MLAGIVYYFAHNFAARAQGTDFTDRYAAARMVREGYGHQLYDFHVQEQFQIRYAGRVGEYYIHPPFETLLFLPICLWSLSTGYLIWCLLNVGVLTYTSILFQRHVFKHFDWRVLLPMFFLFPPVLIGFLQGQDSLLLLLEKRAPPWVCRRLPDVALAFGRYFRMCLLHSISSLPDELE